MRSMIEHPHPQVVIECWDGLRTSSKDASDCASVCDTRTRTLIRRMPFMLLAYLRAPTTLFFFLRIFAVAHKRGCSFFKIPSSRGVRG
jgi:hypothetical protein